ncbi:hypothetical protein TNCV_3807421 [Trichonephila clavipes]|nr:hypothetical protein TNCV_3807421 [Trichonephila clavipes]
MDVCKCVVPSRYGGALKSRRGRKSSGEVGGRGREVEGPLNTSSVFSPKTEQNRTITFIVLKAKANDRRKNLALSLDEFRGP